MLIDFNSTDQHMRKYVRQLTFRFNGQIKCLVNGKEVKQAYYINTDVTPHVVRSYDALGDGETHTVADFPSEVRAGWPKSVGILPNMVLSKTVRGSVTFLVPKKYLRKAA